MNIGRAEEDTDDTGSLAGGISASVTSREVPADPGSIFERKYDGHRAQLVVGSGQVTLLSRGGHDYTARFPEIVAAAHGIGWEVTLDGELTAMLEDQRDDLSALLEATRGHARVVSRVRPVGPVRQSHSQPPPVVSKASTSDRSW